MQNAALWIEGEEPRKADIDADENGPEWTFDKMLRLQPALVPLSSHALAKITD